LLLLVQLCPAAAVGGCGERAVGCLRAKGARFASLTFWAIREGEGGGGGADIGWGRAAEARRIIDRAAQAL
jgi:hypothetical protein